MEEWTWINANCNSVDPDWYERKFPEELTYKTRRFNRTYRIKETFPVEEGDSWHVTERGIVVEDWVVTAVAAKKNNFTVSIYQDRPFYNE